MKYVDLSVDFDTVDMPKILDYMKQYHIITDATLGILERASHGTINGEDGLLSLCKYLVRHGIDVSGELDKNDKYNAPGHYPNNCGYGNIYYIYDKNYLTDESARRIADKIACEWCK